jgi:hypothetical protein
MSWIKSAAGAFAFVIAATPAAAQEQAPASAASLAAADALIEASIPGVVDELTRQLPTVFQRTLAADLSAEQQAELRERLVVLPDLIRAAMEQRWVDRPAPEVPPALQTRLDAMMRDTYAGRRGEIGAARPPTREVVAASLAQRFTQPQLERVGAFLATPPGREMSYRFAVASVQNRAPDINSFSPEVRAALAEFANTPEGGAYLDDGQWVTEMVVEQLRLNTMTRGPEIMLEFTGIMCDVLGPDCETLE